MVTAFSIALHDGPSKNRVVNVGGNPIPERSAQRVLKAADQILKAGAIDAVGAA